MENEQNIKIREALGKLDSTNGEQWTAQDLPRVDVVTNLAGLPDGSIKRVDITNVAPDFTRTNNTLFPPDAPVTEIEPSSIASQIAASIATLQSQRTEKEAAVTQVKAEIALLQKREQNLHAEIGKINEQIERETPQQSNQDAIMAYIASNNRERENRAARKQGLIDAGVDPSELRSAMSPLDAAMQRGRSRGAQRPQFPVKQ